jgi:hypothetical protein
MTPETCESCASKQARIEELENELVIWKPVWVVPNLPKELSDSPGSFHETKSFGPPTPPCSVCEGGV